jgi:hypothetical protein
MSVGYSASSVGFTDYFPAYELNSITITTNIPLNSTYTINLTKNRNNATNYMCIIQLFNAVGTTNVFTLSQINQFIIYDKTASSYKVWLNSSAAITLAANSTIYLWCVTFYPHQTERAIASSIGNYKTNSLDYNPCNYFPQFAVDTYSYTYTSPGEYSATTSLATKNTLRTDYYNFGSVTNNAVSGTNAGFAQRILYYENPKSNTAYVTTVKFTGSVTVTFDTISMYVPSIPSNNFVSNYNVNSVSLEKTFPVCEILSSSIGSTATNRSADMTLTKNTRNTTDYIVLSSFSYLSPGSGGTYNPYQASENVGMPIISSKTETQFKVSFTTTNGNIWNGAIRCLVIYI